MALDVKFWKSLESLDIYALSKEAEGGVLADQLDASSPGGANASDAEEDSPESKEQNNDDFGSDDFSMDESGGDSDMSMDGGDGEGGDMGDDGAGGEGDGGDTSGDAGESEDPKKNPFKGANGKALIDNKLAELQTAIQDTLDHIKINPKVEEVVVQELEDTLDSVRQIRETTYVVPLESTIYKYRLCVISYQQLSKEIVKQLKQDDFSSSSSKT